jgi:hypothetical protein
MKANIRDLAIELTRRCNMECSHCLRGASQKKDMTIDTLNTIFSKVDYIDTLTLGGGENSLKPENINNLIDSLERNNVRVGSFYVVTNAKRLTQPFFNAILRLYNYCDDNEVSSINWSNDNFHEEVNYRNLEKLEEFKDMLMYCHNASDFIVSTKWDKMGLSYSDLLAMGNASNSGHRSEKLYKFEIEENSISEGIVYVAYNGSVFPSCNLSYNIMDNCNKINLGNVHDNDFNFINAVTKFNDLIGDNINHIEINELDLINEGLLIEA